MTADLRHGLADVGDGVRLHYVEAGEGPLVLFVHGFPESWYSWRHQLPAVAAAGYRAVAIDVRGYGRSSKPAAIDAYRMTALVGDNVRLLQVLGEERAVIVGHDWGSPIAWHSALLRPDLFHALAMLSVPYSTRSRQRPTTAMQALAPPGEEFYIVYFQQPGRAEAEIEADVRRWLLGFLVSASGDAPPLSDGTIASVPTGARLCDRFHVPADGEWPAWLTPDDLAFYASEFEHGGFAGPLHRYRNIDRDWEDAAVWGDQPIEVPALFVGGDRDGPTIWGSGAIGRFPETLPRLWRSEILAGCGHWTQQERPDDVNRLLLDFLASLR